MVGGEVNLKEEGINPMGIYLNASRRTEFYRNLSSSRGSAHENGKPATAPFSSI